MVSFNRLPALATAVSKTVGTLLCIAYACDLITLEYVNSRASARHFIQFVLTKLGAPPSPAKSIPLRQHTWHLLFVDRQVRQQHCQLDVLDGLECMFPKKDNVNRLLCALHWMNMMFKR